MTLKCSFQDSKKENSIGCHDNFETVIAPKIQYRDCPLPLIFFLQLLMPVRKGLAFPPPFQVTRSKEVTFT